jgi:hypothetical protein
MSAVTTIPAKTRKLAADLIFVAPPPGGLKAVKADKYTYFAFLLKKIQIFQPLFSR